MHGARRDLAPQRQVRLAKRARGFTLIELLLVVSVLMIAVAMVTTRIDLLLPSTRTEACARMLAGDIANARASAIAQGLPYSIEYDVKGNAYRIVMPYRIDGSVATDEESRVSMEWMHLPEGVQIKELIVGNTVYKDGTRKIDVKPNGNTIEHVVHLFRELPPTDYYLVVQGLTGFVQFYDDSWAPETVTEGDFQ
jgi:prepilin-type N-terminal cleavage/methylation domain-containing protein